MERRQFLLTSGAAAVCACAGGGVSACKRITGVSDTQIAPTASYRMSGNELVLDLEKVQALGTVGGSVKIEIENEKYAPLKIIVARTGDRDYLALYNKCTHGEREMEYSQETGTLNCVSFGHSRFKASGEVLEGPAEKALKKFPVTLEDKRLKISV